MKRRKNIRKFISVLLSALMLVIFMGTPVFADPSVAPKSKEDASKIIAKAKAGDKEAINTIKNLSIWDQQKVEIALGDISLSKENPKATVAFDDGSSIDVEIVTDVKSTDSVDLTATKSASIPSFNTAVLYTYRYLGIPFGQMRLHANCTAYTSYVHINYTWVDGWCEGSFSPGSSWVSNNNDNPASCIGSGTFTVLGVFSTTVYIGMNVYLSGYGYIFYP